MKKKLIFGFVVVFIFSLASCAKQFDATKKIVLKSNLAQPENYRIEVVLEDNELEDYLNIIVTRNNQPVSSLVINSGTIELNVKAEQKNIPYSFFKGRSINGTILFIPEESSGSPKSLPFNLYVKPWILTNFWIILIGLGLVTGLILLDFGMLIFLPEARGTVQFIRPPRIPHPIYPPSRINHFIRNKYSIGANEKDDFYIENIPFLKSSQLTLKYFRRLGSKNRVRVRIKSATGFYHKEEKYVSFIYDTNSSRPQKYRKKVPDYEIADKKEFHELEDQGYTFSKSCIINFGETLVCVLNEKIILKITT
jgi:hypothetical protein